MGTKCPGRLFLLFYRRREDNVVRFGVTASRRVGNAVVRNRAKRIMREAIRDITPELTESLDMVLVARPGIRSAGMIAILSQLSRQLHRAGLLRRGRLIRRDA